MYIDMTSDGDWWEPDGRCGIRFRWAKLAWVCACCAMGLLAVVVLARRARTARPAGSESEEELAW